MSHHAKMNFSSLCPARSASQGRSQPPFEARDRTFDLHALAIFVPGKTAVHLTPVLGLGPAPSATLVQFDHAEPNAQFFADADVIRFRIVASVGKQSVNTHALACAAKHWRQHRRILRRPVTDQGMNQKMGGVVTSQRELRPTTQSITFLPDSMGIMGRAISCFQASGVDAGLFFPADHPLLGSVGNDRIEQSMKQTFLSRRCCAL